MTIEDLYTRNKISARALNVCKTHRIQTVEELCKYYIEYSTFIKLRNCGRKSSEELVAICLEYKEMYVVDVDVEEDYSFPELTKLQREIINSFIEINTGSLSKRSMNTINYYLDGNFKIKKLIESGLLDEQFKFDYRNNTGAKTISELKNFTEKIRDFISNVIDIDDEKKLISLRNNFLIRSTFSIPHIPKEILETESIFALTNFLFEQNAFFDKKETLILKLGLQLANNQTVLNISDIADKVSLSRERVRQIRKKCLGVFAEKLSFIQNFHDDFYEKYGLDITKDIIELDDEAIHRINKINDMNLSRGFITYIILVYLSDSFSVVGNYEDVLQQKKSNSRDRHNWNNFYLVKKEISSKFDFISLVDDISNRISDRIDDSYSFNFKSYLSKFRLNNNVDILNSMFPICETIVNEEFEMYLDLNENITFKRNTHRQVHKYAYEALEHLGKESSVKAIFEKVIELHPNYDTDEAKIRVSMKRKNGFVPISRKSVFGLQKWENELDDFKGGTIRNIVEEYLMQFSVPKHISDIAEHVLKYRPKSNQYSILQNLKLDESGLYIFFESSHIGLTTKKYNSDFKKISEVKKADKKTWEESFEMLQNFVSFKKRLPFSNGVPEKEIKLYRWLNVQKNKQTKGKLAKNEVEKLNILLAKYPRVNSKRRLKSNDKYQELISFVSNNLRLPSVNKNGEESLYYFFYKQRKLFDKNELDNKEENKFIEVAKLLQNIKYENKRN